MQIAVLGGSFDPPHNGHLLLAKEILRTLPIDEVWLMPCYSHPFAKDLSPAKHRLAMTKLLTQQNIQICTHEISQESISYSIDTLSSLQTKFPTYSFSFIIGSDQIHTFPKWKDWKRMLTNFSLIIYPRDATPSHIRTLVQQTIPSHLQKRVTLLNSPKVKTSTVSSSSVRKAVASNKSLRALVSKDVARYIKVHNLYQSHMTIDTQKEIQRITSFIHSVLTQTKKKNVVLAVSGGIDSATSAMLLKQSLKKENIHLIHLPYDKPIPAIYALLKNLNIPKRNWHTRSIKDTVDMICAQLTIPKTDKIRRGNIMARIRMILVYDLAKKFDALVCGTENKSEYYLGYFTRFGDEASDFEPIQHLYKTQVYQLARELSVPETILASAPTAGLWRGQTDEAELGFSYTEADQVIHLFIDKQTPLQKIPTKEYPNAKAIITHIKANSFKHAVPYTLDTSFAKSD